MSTIANAAMFIGGAGLSNLWDYNRSNYMFDVPLMQSKAFQIQNLNMSRLGVFREDVRDLASLTTDKVQSYLIVNTLKLGFIVTVFFNFDRSATEMKEMNFLEAEVDVLLGACFCCAFFWLLTSIWFSMHAVIVAQSVTTKFLLQAARLPAPDAADPSTFASSSLHFERNLLATVRLPFVGRSRTPERPPRGCSEPDLAAQRGPPPEVHAERSASSFGASLTRSFSASFTSFGTSSARTTGTSSTRARPGSEERDPEAAPWGVRLGRGTAGGRGRRELLRISDVLEGSGDRAAATRTGEPHLKLLNMLRSNWSAFDLYGKISMVLGTVNLLMGLAFYCLYYFRTVSGSFWVEPSGWLCFATFSVLAWWCVAFEMSMSHAKSVMVASAMLGGPLCIVLLDISESHLSGGVDNNVWVFRLVAGLTSLWESGLCWSGVSWGNKWPTQWRCSLFLNPLYLEAGPVLYEADLSGHHHFGEGLLGMDAGGGRGAEAAVSLLPCLDAVLISCAPIAHADADAVRRARDELHDLCRAAGVCSDCWNPIEGFWLKAPGGKGRACWIEPSLYEPAAPAPDAAQVCLDDLLGAAHRASRALQHHASSWTRRDMEELAATGGHRVEGPRGFMAQFQPAGSLARHPMGHKASLMYIGGCVLTSLLWASVLAFSCYASVREKTSHSVL